MGSKAKVVSAAVGRKGAEEKKSARDRIFDTACELFYRHGIRAVGVETIASEAGATKMSLYRNFPSKDELVTECLRERAREAWSWVEQVIAEHAGDPRAQLEALCDAAAAKTCDSACGSALTNAVVELHEPEHPARAFAMEQKAQFQRRLREIARSAGANDDTLADGLYMLIEGAYVARVTLAGETARKALPAAARALMTACLGPR